MVRRARHPLCTVFPNGLLWVLLSPQNRSVQDASCKHYPLHCRIRAQRAVALIAGRPRPVRFHHRTALHREALPWNEDLRRRFAKPGRKPLGDYNLEPLTETPELVGAHA